MISTTKRYSNKRKRKRSIKSYHKLKRKSKQRKSKSKSKQNFYFGENAHVNNILTIENLDKYYFSYFNELYTNIKLMNFNTSSFDNKLLKPQLQKIKIHPEINKNVYDNLKDSSKYIEYSGLIKYLSDEYDSGIFGIFGYRKCISEGTWSGNPIVNFYECYRPDLGISTYRFGTNITLSKTTGFNHTMDINSIVQKVNNCMPFWQKKGIICFSLLSPSNPSLGNQAIKIAAAIVNKKAAISAEEPKILDAELNSNIPGCTFISFPLSSNKKSGITLFDYDYFKKKIISNDISLDFYNLIEINTAKNTFESIVKVAELFYNKYKNTHVLVYHCKSGKDRTSIFDSVVQSTFF